MNQKAFTLVELIVVITILAILATIAYISLIGYQSDARNSTRVSDMQVMKRALEYNFIERNKYPQPDEAFSVSYDGELLWSQGVFGQGVQNATKRLSNIPLDPQSKIPYTYSVSGNGREYQLGYIQEAGAGAYRGKVTGNYNGLLLARNAGDGNVRVFGVPSLISSATGATTAQEIAQNGAYVLQGGSNLPGGYSAANGLSTYNENAFAPGSIPTYPIPLIYSGSLENDSEKTILGSNTQDYYLNGSPILEQSGNINGNPLDLANKLVNSGAGGLNPNLVQDEESVSGEEAMITSEECYDPSNIASVGQMGWNGCEDMLIVNRSMLDNATDILGGVDQEIIDGGRSFTFGNSADNIFTGQVTNFSALFESKINFNADINYWDVSNVTTMSHAFRWARSFNQDLDEWDVSNVEDFQLMFYESNDFNGDISSWDLSSATNMYRTFYNTLSFNSDISQWNVASITNMTEMFRKAQGFNRDLSSWCVTNFPTQPHNFSIESSGWTLPKPVWGTCPSS